MDFFFRQSKSMNEKDSGKMAYSFAVISCLNAIEECLTLALLNTASSVFRERCFPHTDAVLSVCVCVCVCVGGGGYTLF